MPDNNKYKIVEEDYDNVLLQLHDAYDSVKEFSDQWYSFVHHLKPGSKILTIGGSLTECSHLHELGFSVTNIDISQRMLDHIKTNCPRITTINANIKDFYKGSYDGVWACRSLIHIPPNDLDKVLENVNNLVNPFGIIGMIFFTQESPGYKEELIQDRLAKNNASYYRVLYQISYLTQMISNLCTNFNVHSCMDNDKESCVYFEIKKQV